MKTTIIGGWDKIYITRVFLLEFQLVVIEANTLLTPFFKEIIVVKEIVEPNVNIDPTCPMLEVVENCLQPIIAPPSTSVGPNQEQYINCMHKLALLQKWGAIYQPKSLWDLKTEITSLHFTDFTIISLCKHHVSLLLNIIHYYNLLQ